MRAMLLAALVLAGCHDFDDELRRCVDAGRCAGPDASVEEGDAGTDAGAPSDAGEAQEVCARGLCWESPRPSGLRVDDVVALSASEAWFVGEGVVTHVQGDRLVSFATGGSASMSVASDGQRVVAVQGAQVWDLVARARYDSPNSELDPLRVIHHVGDGGFVIGGVNTLAGLRDDFGLFPLEPVLSQEVTAITGRQGALRCAVTDGTQGVLLNQRDDADLTQGWTSSSGPDGGDYRALAVDTLGQTWVAVGETTWFDDGFRWALASPVDVADLELVGALMYAVTRTGEVARCSTPTGCNTRARNQPSLTAISSAGGVQYVAGEHGTMLRLEADGGATRLDTQRDVVFNGLQLFSDGTGWAAANTGLWKRVDGRWSAAQASTASLNAVAVVGGELRIASDEGMQQLVSGQLRVSRMVTADGGNEVLRTIAVVADGNDGGLAVGVYGSVYRLTSNTTWTTVHPLDGGAECRWSAYLDAGNVCTFGGVLPRPTGFVAVGNLSDNTGVVLSVSGDHVVATQTPTVRAGITSLSDGGVFICGWDARVLMGDPANLVSLDALGFPGCTSVTRVGEQLFATTTTRALVVLDWDDINATWRARSTSGVERFGVVTTLGDEVVAAGDLTTIVRFRPDGG